MLFSMMLFIPILLRRATLKPNFAHRQVCFDQKVAENLFYKEHFLSDAERLERNRPDAWRVDNLRTGAELDVNGMHLTVLNRPTNYLCVVQEKKSGQVFTVRTANLPPTDRTAIGKGAQQSALETLRGMFDPRRVESLTVHLPFSARGPLLCEARGQSARIDYLNNYLVVQYHDDAPSLALPCTTSAYAPLRSPMKIAILDSDISPAHSFWDTALHRPTAVDLLRMASFPKNALRTHFYEAESTATQPDIVLSAMAQVVLWPAVADVSEIEEADGEEDGNDELYDEEFETNFVIGHYEVDEDNKPVPGAFDN